MLALAVAIGTTLIPIASPVLASTIPFSAALVANHNPTVPADPYFVYDVQTKFAPPTPANASQAVTGAWGAVGGTARADLASGQLGGSVYGNLTGLGVYDLNTVYSQTNAYFGDGFRASDASGSPFTWQTGSTARFGITVDGSMTGSRSPAALESGAFAILEIFQPGTLDPNHVFGYQPNLVTTYFYQIGNPNLQVISCDFAGNCTPLVPSGYIGNLSSGPVTVTQDFQPGGDFDWMVLLGAYGKADVPAEAFNYDFSHTLTFSYEGPDGSTTQSVSGLFNNYDVPPPTPTPEPATLALLGLGLAGLASVRRRNSH